MITGKIVFVTLSLKILFSFLLAGRVSMEDVVGPCNVKPFRMDEEDMAIVWTDNGEDGSLCLKVTMQTRKASQL